MQQQKKNDFLCTVYKSLGFSLPFDSSPNPAKKRRERNANEKQHKHNIC